MRVKSDQLRLRIVMTLVKLCAGLFLLVWALPGQAAEQKVTQVIIQTNMGNIEVELNPEKAPNTVKNFLRYVDSNFYDGTIFHRVMFGFMIQGGGFTKDLDQKKTFDPIAIESSNGLKNDRGTIAMARTGNPNSATSQFFINTRDNDALNYSAPTMRGYGYTVFGKVVQGMDVVDKIEVVNTATRGDMDDVPVKPVIIEKISVGRIVYQPGKMLTLPISPTAGGPS